MIVISDMMGTLTTGSPVLGIVDWIRNHQSRLQAEWLTARMMPGYLLTKTGFIDEQLWKQQAMVDSLTWVREVTPEKFASVAEWTVEKNLWPRRRPEVIERLSWFVQQGAQVYLASSVVTPIAQLFASRFGAQAIGTPVSISQGRIHLPNGLVTHERKIQEVFSQLQISRVDYALGDSYMDIPMLENADHPIAVHPDQRLLAAAKQHSWEVLG